MSDTKSSVLKTIKQLQLDLETVIDEDDYRRIRDEIFALVKPEFFHVLRADLYHPNYRRRMAAAANLGRLGDEKAVFGMIELLQDPLVPVREMAVFGLGLLRSAEAIPPLLDLFGDHSSDVRYRVLIALRELGYPHLEVILIRAMGDDNASVRIEAMTQLSRIGTVKALPVVLKGLLDRDFDVQILSEVALDLIVPGMSDAAYRFVNDGLSLRERRLVLNYFENRNLHYVFTKLYEVLHAGHNPVTNSELTKYGRILNGPDEEKYLIDVHGRDDVVNQIYQHFLYGNERSIILVGDSGCGKTAIVHGVARLFNSLAENQAESSVGYSQQWTILETSTTELITDTRFLGEWETKLKKMLEAIEEAKGQVIVYVTNVNDLLGAGAHSNSEENFADFFTPYIQRGKIKFLAETTDDELRRGLAKEPAFLRLFKQVRINNMTQAETLEVLDYKASNSTILWNIKQRWVELAEGFVGLHENSEDAQDSDENPFSWVALPDWANLEDCVDPPVVPCPGCLSALVHFALSFMSRTALPGAACDLFDQVLEGKRLQLEEELPTDITDHIFAPDRPKDNLPWRNPIDLQISDVTQSLAKSSGIPLSLLDPSVSLDIDHVRDWFTSRLIGQPHVVTEIIERLATIKAGLNHPNRPLAVYFLVGPTGVGKTYFAKLLAEYLFGDKERLVRFDLSEYQGSFAVEKLVGSPHNKQREGLLTEAIRNQPFSVLLLDEFEKANEEIFSLFLQVFDDARLSDAQGKTTDFRQTVILLTSNLGASKTSLANLGFGGDSLQHSRNRIHDKLRSFFTPEFLNRLDHIIPFDALDQAAIHQVVDLEIADVNTRRGLAANHLMIEVTEAAREWLGRTGFSAAYGARQLRRTIERTVIPAVATLRVSQPLREEYQIKVDINPAYQASDDATPGDAGALPPLLATWGTPLPRVGALASGVRA